MLDNSGGKYDTWWGAGSGGVAEVTTVLMTTCKGGMRCSDWSCGVANIPIPIQYRISPITANQLFIASYDN